MKSRSKASGETEGPDMGLGTRTGLTSVVNSLGLLEIEAQALSMGVMIAARMLVPSAVPTRADSD